jgi:anti-sigma-K factor RskA
MSLPDHLLANNYVVGIMTLACTKRTEQSARQHVAAHRVRVCEETLRDLREDLLEANRNLIEVESDIDTLRGLFLQLPATAEGEELSQILASPYCSHSSDFHDCGSISSNETT